jgi:tetratricopeptide (TPR) repeat protein
MISEGRLENFYYWHHFDDAIRTIQALQAQDPDHTRGFNWALGRAYTAKGNYPEAVTAFQVELRYENSPASKLGMARVQALAGDLASARAVLAGFEGGKTTPTGMALDLASVHLALGEKEAALALLAKGIREHEPDGAELRWDPRFESLKDDPRFLELRQQMVALSSPQRP